MQRINARRSTTVMWCVAAVSTCCLMWVFQTAVSAGNASAQILVQGRFGGITRQVTGVHDMPLLFSWPASCVHTSFMSGSVHATLSALPATAMYDVNSRFAFFVDQRFMGFETTGLRQTTISWSASDLGPGDKLAITAAQQSLHSSCCLWSQLVSCLTCVVKQNLHAQCQC